MPRKQIKTPSAAILPGASGKKKVFGDDEETSSMDAYPPAVDESRLDEEDGDMEDEDDLSVSEEDDSDDDEAPEAVGISAGKAKARADAEELAM